MEKLIESIACAGVMQAILVSERDGKRFLLAGYNRVYASRKANKKMIPAIIKRDLSRITGSPELSTLQISFPEEHMNYS